MLADQINTPLRPPPRLPTPHKYTPRTLGNPGTKRLNLWVHSQRFQRVIMPLEFFVRQNGMNLLVTGSAKMNETTFHLISRKIFLVLLILMPRTRNEMMFRDLVDPTMA